ncbi:MAG: 4Fe-4S dicluster domain-containing protein [candidate division Zixibacteria bacterium]|nr:4Fe-4S dicluster domain-containing protein [candidate division Zixibacteria bacterium]MDH3937866.1 4Fe-4S dicluster domain-containing protein [candidate division Zixibacteria bacterium]MDH4034304.1 4Fe-4S dicluster domain-containing protein [candidate division Zixibacteria bacterium]
MNIGRRDFLKLGATASCMAGLAGGAEATEEFDGWPDSLGMLVDTTICIGSNCRRCEEACKKVNDLSLTDLDLSDDSVFDNQRRTDSDNFTVVNRFDNPNDPDKPIFVKRQCMHCAEPACASACLVRAFTKSPEGAVVYNPDVCIGCRYCMVACPFYAPAYDYFDAASPEVRKCTMCHDRIKEGRKPACAEICPKEAITFGKRSDLIKLARDKIRNHPDRYQDHIYGENEVGGTSWLYLAGVDFANLGFDTNLGNTEYPLLTRGFLSAVPLVLTIWPVLLVGLYRATKERGNPAGQDGDTNEERAA